LLPKEKVVAWDCVAGPIKLQKQQVSQTTFKDTKKSPTFGESRKGSSQSCLTVQKTADLEETQRSIHLQHLGGTQPVWTGGERP